MHHSRRLGRLRGGRTAAAWGQGWLAESWLIERRRGGRDGGLEPQWLAPLPGRRHRRKRRRLWRQRRGEALAEGRRLRRDRGAARQRRAAPGPWSKGRARIMKSSVNLSQSLS
eukprot:COSAG01_NODE_1888_length_8979_cov_78.343806_3_plen_113_part_00